MHTKIIETICTFNILELPLNKFINYEGPSIKFSSIITK